MTMNNDDLVKRLRKARGLKNRKMCQEAANVIEYLDIAAKDLEFTCFVGGPHKVTECPYVDRLADLEVENDDLKEKLKDSFQGYLLDELEKKDVELTRAKKCITDCETYLILGDGRYAARNG